MQPEYKEAVGTFVERARQLLGDSLVSIVLYGSVARGAARPESDVDVLLIARELPNGPRRRRERLKSALDEAERLLQARLPDAWVSLVMKTPDEAQQGGPIFYDMTLPGHAELLFDSGGYMSTLLDALALKMQALGARRLSYLGHPYWDLKPDFKPGDVVDL